MIDIPNILRLAGDGYDARDIRQLTRIPIPVIKHVCKDAGVRLAARTERAKPPLTVVKKSQKEAEVRYQLKRAAHPAEKGKEPAPPKTRENPVLLARNWLGKRLVEKPAGYWLDGVPVNLDAMMRAANRLVKAAGAEQCCHSERWRV